jgi:poly [ADP-ribose] polymerase
MERVSLRSSSKKTEPRKVSPTVEPKGKRAQFAAKNDPSP